MRILYCISDHGFGHAARSLPTIRALMKRGHTVIIRNSSATKMLRKELPDVQLLLEKNDIGVMQRQGSYLIDRAGTKRSIGQWLGSIDQDVRRTVSHIAHNKIDLVLSDSAPQPLRAAKLCRIPGLFIGTFTWLDIYSHLRLLSPAQRRLLTAMYNDAALGIIMPFAAPCAGIRKKRNVALISRHPHKKMVRIPRSILLSAGGSMSGTKPWKAKNYTGFLVTPPQVSYDAADKTIRIRDEQWFDYLSAVDCVIGKSGYGVASESIRCRKPLFLMRRPGFLDDEIVIPTLVKRGICREVTAKQLPALVTDAIFEEVAKMQKNYKRLPRLYREDGIPAAVSIIEGFA